MLLCVQAVTAKGHPKFRKAREEKTAFSLQASLIPRPLSDFYLVAVKSE